MVGWNAHDFVQVIGCSPVRICRVSTKKFVMAMVRQAYALKAAIFWFKSQTVPV